MHEMHEGVADHAPRAHGELEEPTLNLPPIGGSSTPRARMGSCGSDCWPTLSCTHAPRAHGELAYRLPVGPTPEPHAPRAHGELGLPFGKLA